MPVFSIPAVGALVAVGFALSLLLQLKRVLDAGDRRVAERVVKRRR